MPKTPQELIADTIDGKLRILLIATNATGQQTDELLPIIKDGIARDVTTALAQAGMLSERREFRCRLDDCGSVWEGGDDTMRDHARDCSGGIHDERTAAGSWVMVDWERVG